MRMYCPGWWPRQSTPGRSHSETVRSVSVESQAFVAAWLPGSEGGGVADVLFGEVPFRGRLGFDWAGVDGKTRFTLGHGLSTGN